MINGTSSKSTEPPCGIVKRLIFDMTKDRATQSAHSIIGAMLLCLEGINIPPAVKFSR